ncbi:MAG: MFS transporter [Pseudomonadota bacterium]|nr:MFS transporter [Pseudomonadota bacterium]
MTNQSNQAAFTSAQTISVLVGSSIMLTMSMGMRQSWGLFMDPVTTDLGISIADFTLAIAIQNLIWGITQPIIGAFADKFGCRVMTIFGTFLYAAGLGVTMIATGPFVLILGMGVMIGIALSCTALSLALAASARAVSTAKRSVVLGTISAAGSIGSFIAAPLAENLITNDGWIVAMIAFLGLCVVMLPAAFFVGSGDKPSAEMMRNSTDKIAKLPLRDVLKLASQHRAYMTMAIAYFVCGLQLIFIATHLPAYLQICGQSPELGAYALGVIGGFNAIGCYVLGWLGDRYPKHVLLGGVYILRSAFIVIYFLLPATPTNTLVFAAVMGLLWLGVAPLVAGLVTQMFGLRYVATLTGIAFFFHQTGSFAGVWGAGLLVGAFGNYDLAWQIGVAIGIIAGLAQILVGDKPSPNIRVPAPA